MIMTKEINKSSLDNTAQSYLKDTESFLSGSYDEYNKRVKSVSDYIQQIKSMSEVLNAQLLRLRQLGVDVSDIVVEEE